MFNKLLCVCDARSKKETTDSKIGLEFKTIILLLALLLSGNLSSCSYTVHKPHAEDKLTKTNIKALKPKEALQALKAVKPESKRKARLKTTTPLPVRNLFAPATLFIYGGKAM